MAGWATTWRCLWTARAWQCQQWQCHQQTSRTMPLRTTKRLVWFECISGDVVHGCRLGRTSEGLRTTSVLAKRSHYPMTVGGWWSRQARVLRPRIDGTTHPVIGTGWAVLSFGPPRHVRAFLATVGPSRWASWIYTLSRDMSRCFGGSRATRSGSKWGLA